MLPRDAWLHLARKLDWTFRYVSEDELFPPEPTGTARVSPGAWAECDEPFKTTYREYVFAQSEKERAVRGVRDAVGRPEHMKRVPASWYELLRALASAIAAQRAAACPGAAPDSGGDREAGG